MEANSPHDESLPITDLVTTDRDSPSGRVNLLLTANSLPLQGREITNFVGSKVDRYKLVQRCLGPSCLEGKSSLGRVINMAFYYVTSIDQLNEETGEYRPAIYVCIIDVSGEATGFWSAFVARDLGRLIQSLGEPSPESPVSVRVVEADRPGKRAWYTLELV